MFTTDLSHRVFLTVSLLLLVAAPLRIGICQEATERREEIADDYSGGMSNRGAFHVNGVPDQMYDEARFYQSSSPSEDLVLALNDNPVEEEELMHSAENYSKGRSARMDWRKGESSQSTPSSSSGMQTVISSTSYSVKPGNSASTVILNTKPVGIITTGSSSDDRKSSSSPFYSPGSSYPQYSSSSSSSSSANYNNKKGEQSTYYQNYDTRNNNCFGKKCLMTMTEEGLHPDHDEWKTYHSKLNSDIKKNKNYQEYPSGGSNYGDGFSSGGRYQSRYSTIPFTIDSSVPGKHSHYADSYPLSSSSSSRPGHRVSRTTTTSTTTKSPGWVQLQPLFSSTVYDPFAYLNNNISSSGKTEEFANPQTQITKRIGVELNPDSFAERHGWGNSHHITDQGGSRLPSWLEQLNQHQHTQNGIRRPGPTRDEDIKNWVKLDPIAVAGVTISKWVPKGTPTSELPTTNWGIRDKPNSYWDTHQQNQHNSHHTDSQNILRPPIGVSSGGDHGWPSKGSSPSYTTRYPDFLNNRFTSATKKPTNSWGDIIYPEGLTSATASWEANKAGLSNYPSSFPLSHHSPSSSNSWPSDTRRRPTGSWSAPSNHNNGDNNRRFAIHRNPTNLNGHFDRNYSPPSYPDLEAHNDDPRWVLVSNSRRVTVSPHHTASHTHSLYNRNRPPYLHETGKLYNNDLDRYPYNSGHRLSKDLFKRASTTPTTASIQDDAFDRVNATLQTLIPVLKHRGSGTSTRRPPILKTITPSSLEDNRIDDNIGNGRANSANATIVAKKRNRKGLGLNPVYAAVGAGMIPATMAAVLPMVLGRKKRGVQNSYTVVNLNDADIATLKFLSSISNKSSSKEVVFSKLANVPVHERGTFDTRGDVYSSYKTISHKKTSTSKQHVLR